jgi:hypothetical protein
MSVRMTQEELLAQLAFLGPVHFPPSREDEPKENIQKETSSQETDAERINNDEGIEESLYEQQDTDDMHDDDDDETNVSSPKIAQSGIRRRSVLSRTHYMTLLAAVAVVVAMVAVRTVSRVRINNTTIDTVNEAGAQRHLQSIQTCPFDVSFGYSPFFGPSKTTEHHCFQAPTLIGLQLIGGKCEDNVVPSQTIQDFRCEDFNGGPPQPGNTDKIHVRATDNEGTILYAADNRVGDVVYLYNDFQPLGKYTTVTLSTADDASDANSLLQTVTFDAGCSIPSFLGNVLGAHQIVRFSNPVQQSISIDDAPQPTVVISITDATSNVEVTQLDVATNFTSPRKFDYSSIVSGVVVGPSSDLPTLEFSFKSMNMFFPQVYHTTVTGTGKLESGQECVFEVSDMYNLP